MTSTTVPSGKSKGVIDDETAVLADKRSTGRSYPEDVPREPEGDDSAAIVFWSGERKYPCGRGSTPNEALATLDSAPLQRGIVPRGTVAGRTR